MDRNEHLPATNTEDAKSAPVNPPSPVRLNAKPTCSNVTDVLQETVALSVEDKNPSNDTPFFTEKSSERTKSTNTNELSQASGEIESFYPEKDHTLDQDRSDIHSSLTEPIEDEISMEESDSYADKEKFNQEVRKGYNFSPVLTMQCCFSNNVK